MNSSEPTKKYNTRYSSIVNEKKRKITALSPPLYSNNKRYHKSTPPPESEDEEEDDDEDEDDEDYDDDEDEDEDDDDDEDDEDYDDDDDDVESEFAMEEYQKFLSELFPSKYISERVAKTKNTKKTLQNVSSSIIVPKKKSHRKLDFDSDEDNSLCKKHKKHNVTPTKFNISFMINNEEENSDVMSDTEALYDEAYSGSESGSESGSGSGSESESESESGSESESESDHDVDNIINSGNKKSAGSKISKRSSHNPQEEELAFTKMKSMFSSLTPDDLSNTTIKTIIKDIESKEKRFIKKNEARVKKQKIKNTKKLKTLFKERDVMNDLKFFNEQMSLEEQQYALEQFKTIKEHSNIAKPYRLTLLDSNIPPQYKSIAYRKISSLRHMEPGGSEYFKMKNWVDAFMQIPFGKYKNLPISLADGVEKCHEFMDNAKQTLDQAVYGLNDAKLQIMQMIGQWIVNPDAIGTAIAIKGPMGTGKTTLVKDGISKILGRDFAFISLGGATDSSFLEGHSYTYEGSLWGKIVDLIMKCKSMNPVIYFDELDKISDTPKGEEIAGILTHLTDTTQNNQFHDRYFSDIDFDLSRCIFIFSYNDESKVNRILLDRMYRIQTKGYDQPQKTKIANNYLLPKICEQVKFNTTDIVIPETTMHYIISNYTEKEDGVRTLKRCLEIIHTKLNLYRLMRPETNIFENEMSIKVNFPMEITPVIVDKLIKKNTDAGTWQNMYM